MSKSKVKRIIIIIAIVVAICSIVASILVSSAGFFADIAYYFKYYFVLYDGIWYNGSIYYRTNECPYAGVPEGKVPIHLVDDDTVYYDKTEYAGKYEEDPECLFLYFDSAEWTRDKSLLIESYHETTD